MKTRWSDFSPYLKCKLSTRINSSWKLSKRKQYKMSKGETGKLFRSFHRWSEEKFKIFKRTESEWEPTTENRRPIRYVKRFGFVTERDHSWSLSVIQTIINKPLKLCHQNENQIADKSGLKNFWRVFFVVWNFFFHCHTLDPWKFHSQTNTRHYRASVVGFNRTWFMKESKFMCSLSNGSGFRI